jgi:polyisoprenoid-binding protein YceI
MNFKHALTLICLAPTICSAAVWQMIPDKSTLSFTATQNNAPVKGEFKKFTADINFDLQQLNTSKVKIVIDVGSMTNSYNQLSDTLKGADWFNVKVYPQAIFNSTNFKKTGDKTYQADGTLTIRDKTLPVLLNFTVDEDTPTEGRISGNTTIKRTAFGVGQGDWTDTSAIKDEVKIEFAVTAHKSA